MIPLYDTLLSSIRDQKNPLEPSELKNLVKKIHTLDQDGMEKIYVLIRYHDMISTQENYSSSSILPFDGKIYFDESINNDVIEFDIEIIPPILQRILYNFVQLHLKHMKQQIERKKKSSTIIKQ